MFYAGAHLAQHVWAALQRLALETTGERILMLTGLGATETAPFAFMPGKEVSRAGEVGPPAPGIELKLVPLDQGRLDVRLKGPNVTPGYWRQEELTAEAFDEEGFYRLGDALRFVDPARRRRVSRSRGGSRRTSSSPPGPGSTSASCAAPSSRILPRCCATR